MKLDFRIDWGYQYLYSRRHYHPQYIWDGKLECDNGAILESYKLDYPVIWFGPGHCAKETPLEKPEWQSRTKRGMSGARFVAEVNDKTVFHLHTVSFDVDFKASDIIKNGKIDLPVGPKYLGCRVIITKTGYLWFVPNSLPGQTVYGPEQLGVITHDWARMKLAWLSPGQSLKFEADIAQSKADYCEQLLHTAAMAIPAEYTDGKEEQVKDHFTLELSCDGVPVAKYTRYYRHHDTYMQMLEDDWVRFKVQPGHHVFTLKNLNEKYGLGFSKVTLKPCEYSHGQLSIPEWALKDEKVVGKVFAVHPDKLEVTIGNDKKALDCAPGWNEFEIKLSTPSMIGCACRDSKAKIEIIDAQEEACPVKVGYDMTVVPHDDNGQMDWLLDYTQRTRLGNYVVFRVFNPDVQPHMLYRFGEFCRTHGIYVSACNNYLDGNLIKGAGEMMSDCGLHEYPGKVYALDPTPPYSTDDMKQAAQNYIDFLKIEIDKAHGAFRCTAFGDASGGIRYSYLAGVDFVRAETMVPHTMTLLSQARPAAEALGDGRWGVHIAIQHCYQPYHETHLGQYFLSIMQPWVMGANTIYEEDSLFELFKEERQSWDDAMTKGKRDMTRSFFKFVKTHPRAGKCVRNIAFLEGRYAAPFNGFICDVEQDPHYSVWGMFGCNDPTWGHGQPEKCRQILDVLMPGASTHPLRQRFDRRRFFFSGTPYGDFDCIPVESGQQYIDNYKLLLNLGWNTAIPEDCEKLKDYVEQGGVLLTGIPQFSTHTKRAFLADMKDLALINDGDLSDICGIKVKGQGVEYCGQYNCAGRQNMPEPQLSGMPSDSIAEDGKANLAEVELCGAEIVAWDSFSGQPMLVKYKLGEGYVYTFTLWAYPGHELFQSFCAAWVAKLCEQAQSDVRISDDTGEIFWTVWQDGDVKRIYLLNTDWTKKGNKKRFDLVNNRQKTTLYISERSLMCITLDHDKTDIKTYTL